ncbi:hypothetical protein TNCV_36411 [Trichonephila clavipes]|nr:hypothetical protein TNCV_36411 [Trichonephila clavipes]
MSQVRMDCEARMTRDIGQKAVEGVGMHREVPGDPDHNKSYYAPLKYQSPSTKKVAYFVHSIISLKQFGDLSNSLTTGKRHQIDVIVTSCVN